MGSFKRTKSGLNNLRLFHDVNYVIYLEGGNKSYSKSEVYANKFNSDTEDISFWSKIFMLNKKNCKFKFKSVGSKETLKDIAIDLIDNKIKFVYIAMDNEFDEVLNQRLKHPNIFYTFGYSFENDIWNYITIIQILEELTSSNIDKKYIEKGFKKFINKIKIGVFADSYSFYKKKAFFKRKQGHLFCIDCNSNNFPSVKELEITNLLMQKSLNINTIRNYAYKNKIDVIKHCFGHLLADYCCQVIKHYLKVKHKFSNLTKEIIYRMAINKFFQHQYKASDIEKYYLSQFS